MAAHKEVDAVKFKTRAKFIVAANKFFKSNDISYGFLLGLIFVKFDQQFTGAREKLLGAHGTFTERELYAEYKAWCEEGGFARLNRSEFVNDIKLILRQWRPDAKRRTNENGRICEFSVEASQEKEVSQEVSSSENEKPQRPAKPITAISLGFSGTATGADISAIDSRLDLLDAIEDSHKEVNGIDGNSGYALIPADEGSTPKDAPVGTDKAHETDYLLKYRYLSGKVEADLPGIVDSALMTCYYLLAL